MIGNEQGRERGNGDRVQGTSREETREWGQGTCNEEGRGRGKSNSLSSIGKVQSHDSVVGPEQPSEHGKVGR